MLGEVPGQPGVAMPVGVMANADDYYYRRAANGSSEFVLSRKPGRDAPDLQARVVGERFTGVVQAEAPGPRLLRDLQASKLDPVAELFRDGGAFGRYAAMVAKECPEHTIESIRTRAQADVVRLVAKGPASTMDDLRRAVRRPYESAVKAKLVDARLSDAASHGQMRRMLDGLNNTDRGNLAEYWYGQRHAPKAERHAPFAVTRSAGDSAGMREHRVADFKEGRTATEVKDVEDVVDREQFGAYVDELTKPDGSGDRMFDKLKYVFTKVEGAIANLEFMAKAYAKHDLAGKLTVEVFDMAGTKHTVNDDSSAMKLLTLLRRSR